jgi:hypothetical protein
MHSTRASVAVRLSAEGIIIPFDHELGKYFSPFAHTTSLDDCRTRSAKVIQRIDTTACGDDLRTFIGSLKPAQFDAFRENLPGTFGELSEMFMDKGAILRQANMALLAHVIYRVREGDLWPNFADMLDSYVHLRNIQAMYGDPDIPEAAWRAMLAVAIAYGKADVAKAILAAGHKLAEA